MERFEKLRISLRYWLLGAATAQPAYQAPLRAMHFAQLRHTGRRKDGRTPEFMHQLEVAHYLRTMLPHLQLPAETLAAALLHDVCEDYDVEFAELDALFGHTVTGAVRCLTKKHKGARRAPAEYFASIVACPIASCVKGADRINNLQSMLGVFSVDKQKEYMAETEQYFLPMLKSARLRFPQQEPVYENLKLMMNSQLQLLAAAHAAAAAGMER